MSLLPHLLAGISNRLEILPISFAILSNTGVTINNTGVNFGTTNRPRTVYVGVRALTDGATGNRRFINADVIDGANTYTGTRIAAYGEGSAVSNPCALFRIEIPQSVTTATLQIVLAGTGTAAVRLAQQAWVVSGDLVELSPAYANSTPTSDFTFDSTRAGGVALHMATVGAALTLTPDHDIQDQNSNSGTSLYCKAGRYLSMPLGTFTISSNQGRSVGICIGEA